MCFKPIYIVRGIPQHIYTHHHNMSMLCTPHFYMSRVMRTLDLYSCDNKGADQLCSICIADQRLCFHYSASTIPLLLLSDISVRCGMARLYVTCNVQPSQATANPVDGKACSSTKGGLLRYIMYLTLTRFTKSRV